MIPALPNARLVKRAYWLIRLRWVAAVFLAAGTFFCSSVLAIELKDLALYGIATLLVIYNLTVLSVLRVGVAMPFILTPINLLNRSLNMV